MRCKITRFSISNNKGFTLIELMMVVAILGVLTTIAIKTVAVERMKANDAQAVSMMRNLLTAMETDTPPTGNTYAIVDGGIVQWGDGPEIQLGKNLYFTIAEDTDGDTEGKWQVFGAHLGGKLGFYFWIPNEVCSVQKDDKILDSGGSATPADRIVPSFGEIANYVYTDFRAEAIP